MNKKLTKYIHTLNIYYRFFYVHYTIPIHIHIEREENKSFTTHSVLYVVVVKGMVYKRIAPKNRKIVERERGIVSKANSCIYITYFDSYRLVASAKNIYNNNRIIYVYTDTNGGYKKRFLVFLHRTMVELHHSRPIVLIFFSQI